MRNRLQEYLIENLLMEGGLAGHMKHPSDYGDLTGEDLIGMVDSLFCGKIEHMKEKLDGTNLNAYRSKDGESLFIRNQTDLNSKKGGMTVEEISIRYFSKPAVAENFLKAAKVIEEVFSRVPVEFFNPDPFTKIVVNCECISAGQTNVIPYDSDRVAFHGISEYKLTDNGSKWELVWKKEGVPDEISHAAEGVHGTEERPDLIVKSVEDGKKKAAKFKKDIEQLFHSEGLRLSDTIDDWKKKRFSDAVPDWLDPDDVYGRWVEGIKAVSLNGLKKKYNSRTQELRDLDSKNGAGIVQAAMQPMDELVSRIGNELISSLSGFTNSDNSDEVVAQLRDELDSIEKEIRSGGSPEDIEKLDRQLERLARVGDQLNSAEGVVFTYKGRLMKLTGSFSALNQILGMQKFSR